MQVTLGDARQLTLDFPDPGASEHAWVDVSIELNVSGWHGASTGLCRAEELVAFASDLKELLESTDLTGEISFTVHEGQLEVEICLDHGRGVVVGKLRSYLSPEAEMTCRFETDQSYLQESLSQLQEVVTIVPSG